MNLSPRGRRCLDFWMKTWLFVVGPPLAVAWGVAGGPWTTMASLLTYYAAIIFMMEAVARYRRLRAQIRARKVG